MTDVLETGPRDPARSRTRDRKRTCYHRRVGYSLTAPLTDWGWHYSKMASNWGVTPKQSIDAECARHGRAKLVAGCVAILEGRLVDDDLLIVLAGPAALTVLDGVEGGRVGYWPRVWAARGLLHAWDESATQAVLKAATDGSWRVREMTAKVVAAHRIADAEPAMAMLANDPVPRVRRAAERALLRLSD